MSLEVSVKVNGGDSRTFTLPASATIGELRARIATAELAPYSKQRLLVKNKAVNDDSATLAAAGITAGSPTVALIIEGSTAHSSKPGSSHNGGVSQSSLLAQAPWLKDVPEADRAHWFRTLGQDQEVQFAQAQQVITAAHALIAVALKALPEASKPAPNFTTHVRQSNTIPPTSLHPMYPLVTVPSVAYTGGNDKDVAAKECAEWNRMRGTAAATSSSANAAADSDADAAAAAPAVVTRAQNDLTKLLSKVVGAAQAQCDAAARK